MRERERLMLCVCGMVCVVAAGVGCAMFCPRPGPARATESGRIEIDRPACRSLRVLSHSVERDAEDGRLVVTVSWLNSRAEDYKAQVRAAFFDEQGLGERHMFVWHLHTFHPGEQLVSWASDTPDAVRYVIEVRKAR